MAAGAELEVREVERSRVRPGGPEGDAPLVVVHEDADLIVVDKPAGLLTYAPPGSSDAEVAGPMAREHGPLAVGMGEERPGVVHRLDRGTSGVLVLARTEAAMEHLQKRDLDAAERVLGLCIEIADLPECHKTMGTLLALTNNPAAITHFRHYLNVAPTAPDAGKIRRALESR